MPTATLKLNGEAKRIMRFFLAWKERSWTDREISCLCVEPDPNWATEFIDALILLGRLVVVGHKEIDGRKERLVRLNREYGR